MITPQDIIFEFRKYCKAHPLRIIADLFYDEKGHFKIEELAKNSWAINTMNAIQRALTTLCSVSEDAYRDMIHNKLPAKAGKDYDDHQLISAFCELSLMNTFIARSSNPKSFKYEDRCNPDSLKNVEFSIEMADFIFHVEVKTSNLVSEDRKIAKALETSGNAIILDARNPRYKEIEEKAQYPVIGSLDRRLIDYLESANQKFRKTVSEKEINLLVICWDDRIQQPLMALKSKKAEGLLTSQSYNKDADGNPKQYPNVDCILINSGYALFKEYVSFLLFDRFSPEFPVDPFFQLFSNNYLIDNNLTGSRIAMVESIIQQKTTIVDVSLAESLPEVSVAFFKDKEHRIISFRQKNIDELI